ncbi:MAG: hypothetical protein RLZZ604_1318, partial [Pseudomonadota bacterium]
MREFSYAAPCFRSVTSINVGMVCSAFKNGGTDAQKAEWLPRLAAGEIASFGLTEPGSGSPAEQARARAETRGQSDPPLAGRAERGAMAGC